MKSRGFTLIELMLVVSIIGVLAIVASAGVSRAVAEAKTTEVRAAVPQIGKSALAAWERSFGGNTSAIILGAPGLMARRLCGDALAPVPASMAAVRGKKYQSAKADWGGTSTDGWMCLGFAVDGPQRFQYNYVANNVNRANAAFIAIARGDLNGNGQASTFTLRGGATNFQLRLAPTMDELDSAE